MKLAFSLAATTECDEMKHTKSCVRNWKGLSSDHSTSPASSSARCTIAWLHDKSGPVLRNSPVSMAMDRTAKMLVSCVLSTIRSMKKWNGRICWTSWHLQYLTYHKKTQSYSEHSELVLFPPITDLPHAPPFLSSSWTKNIKLKPFRPSRANFWLCSHSWGCVNSSSLQTGQILGETWSAWFEGLEILYSSTKNHALHLRTEGRTVMVLQLWYIERQAWPATSCTRWLWNTSHGCKAEKQQKNTTNNVIWYVIPYPIRIQFHPHIVIDFAPKSQCLLVKSPLSPTHS